VSAPTAAGSGELVSPPPQIEPFLRRAAGNGSSERPDRGGDWIARLSSAAKAAARRTMLTPSAAPGADTRRRGLAGLW